MSRYSGRLSAVSIPQQDLQMRRRFPQFKNVGSPRSAIWIGGLQPLEVSPIYAVRIQYRVGDIPRVWVIAPALHERAPHRYTKEDGRLCLYWPREAPWRPDSVVAETIVPWTALWLFYYELWLDTEQWLGPTPHGDPVKGG